MSVDPLEARAVDAARTGRDDEPDPFGLRAAVAAAGTRVAEPVGAPMWLVRVVGLLPVPLALALAIVAVVSAPNPPATTFAVLLWAWIFAFIAVQLGLVGAPKALDASQSDGPRTGSVLVIGAGPVGLVTIKECRAAGLDVECYEQRDGAGGVFRYTEDFDGGVWRSCTLTSSPWITAFSDLPPEDRSFAHLSHSEYTRYLERYIAHFDLAPAIHYGHTVIAVEPDPSGGWVAEIRDDAAGRVERRTYDRVAVCAGLNLRPKAIDLPGMDTFKGRIRHVATYRKPDDLNGKRVVVVGSGESAVDVAAEIATVADHAILAIPRGKFVIPRINPDNGIPNDFDTNRLRYSTPVAIRDWMIAFKDRHQWRRGHHSPESAVRSRLLHTADSGPQSQTATKNDDFVRPLLDGRLAVRSRVIGFDGEQVLFADGSKTPADEVVFAHGYAPSFPFLTLPPGVGHRHPGLLYLRMFIPDLGDSIAFLGFARPAIGAIPPTGELQARLFALLASGQRRLPTVHQMRLDVLAMLKESKDLFPAMVQPNVVISWIRYMDQLAALIGCRPRGWRLLRRPRLLWRVVRGPANAAVYRLNGPGEAPVAETTIMSLRGTHPVSELATLAGLHFWVWPLALIHPSTAWQTHNSAL